MKIVKGLFWIVAVSLMLAGRPSVSASFADGPAADYLGPDAPSVQSSGQVLEAVAQLRGLCKRHEETCGVVGAIGTFSLRFVDQVLSELLPSSFYKKMDPPKVPKKARVFHNGSKDPFVDGANELLYNLGEELEDIG